MRLWTIPTVVSVVLGAAGGCASTWERGPLNQTAQSTGEMVRVGVTCPVVTLPTYDVALQFVDGAFPFADGRVDVWWSDGERFRVELLNLGEALVGSSSPDSRYEVDGEFVGMPEVDRLLVVEFVERLRSLEWVIVQVNQDWGATIRPDPVFERVNLRGASAAINGLICIGGSD